MSSQARAIKTMNRLIAVAIEMELVSSVADFHGRAIAAQDRIIASASRRMSRRLGQGWSR